MNIDFAFIMCAGKGSRMGEIGKVLPKPLWPVYEITLLELQIIYAKKLGAKEIFINSHHCHDQMMKSFDTLSEKYSHLNVLFEPKLLGSGGGVHQFCRHPKVNYMGDAVYLSGDQFLFFPEEEKKKIEKIYEEKGSCLVANDITDSIGYNRTIFDKDYNLAEIQSDYDRSEKSFTFSGMGYFNLELMTKHTGESSFFDTVCNYKERPIGIHPLEQQQYWDFGTLDRYYESSFRLIDEIDKDDNLFLKHFPKEMIFNFKKLNQENSSYDHIGEKSLRFNIDQSGKKMEITTDGRKKISLDSIVDLID